MKDRTYLLVVSDATGDRIELARHHDRELLEKLADALSEYADDVEVVPDIVDESEAPECSNGGLLPFRLAMAEHTFDQETHWPLLELGGWYSTN